MTNLELRNLKIYLQFREKKMSVMSLLWANRQAHFIYFIIMLLVGVTVGFKFGSPGAWLIAAVTFAVFLRDIGYYRRSVVIWPMLQRIIDWELVESMDNGKNKI